MAIRKICILGLDDYPMLTGDPSLGHIGGESVQHVLLARAWRDLGLDVSIIVHDHGQAHITMVDGIRAVSAFPRAAGIRVLRFVHPRLTSVLSAMRELDADVYYQSPAAPWTGVVAYFAKRFDKHSIFRVASDSDCVRGRQRVSSSKGVARSHRDRWMYEYGLTNVSLVAAQTVHQRSLLAQHFAIKSEILNIAVELPRTTAPDPKDIDVLWVGNFREVKRPDVAVELARRLPQYRFAFVGGSVPGGDSYYQRIATEAKRLSNVTFAGPVAYEQTGKWFDRARLHVNTSDYEGFPNTFLQAWVRRVPVVSFYDPDTVIRRHGLGRVCTGLDEMQMQIDTLLKNRDACAEAGGRGYAYAASEFSAHSIATRYLELLDPVSMRSQRLAAVG